MTRDAIFAAILAERGRQAAKWTRSHEHGWGDCSSPMVAAVAKVAVLSEECGEVARAVLDKTCGSDDEALRRELVQVAAVCTAWLEGL